jgi:hypothetical protein
MTTMIFKEYNEDWELVECFCEDGNYKDGWCELTDGVHVGSCKNCKQVTENPQQGIYAGNDDKNERKYFYT